MSAETNTQIAQIDRKRPNQNYKYSDKLKAAGTLDGAVLTDTLGQPRRWSAIFAHSPSVVNITSAEMTVGDGATTLAAEATTIPAGATFFCHASAIAWVSGEVTCYRERP